MDGGSKEIVSGKIYVIVGPMFAGKTSEPLRRISLEVENGRNVVVMKSSKDTRYAVDAVVTHDGVKFPCLALSDLLSFKLKFGEDAYDKLDVIGIDEAQFLEDLYDFCCLAADLDGKVLLVAGLDGDYLRLWPYMKNHVLSILRKNFGSVIDVISLADSVIKVDSSV